MPEFNATALTDATAFMEAYMAAFRSITPEWEAEFPEELAALEEQKFFEIEGHGIEDIDYLLSKNWDRSSQAFRDNLEYLIAEQMNCDFMPFLMGNTIM